MTLIELIEDSAQQLIAAQVAFGHGTTNAFDEAAWLVLWRLGLPLDTVLDGPDSQSYRAVNPVERAQTAILLEERIRTRKPAAYLTKEAWLQGVSFYVDERAIVPRSLIAELLCDGSIDCWLKADTRAVLDLCTGNGSLAILTALNFPDVQVIASDVSTDALTVARINVAKHGLQERITVVQSDVLAAPELQAAAPFDLIVCNPPYVNAHSMAHLPPEYRAEPGIALDGNREGGSDGMDFIRTLLQQVSLYMAHDAVLLLEIGHERAHFEAAFPSLEAVWLECSAGADQLVLIPKAALRAA
ncbi:MAG: 50S ribosomal protein L3 N(5)-glutamine methyltransferase [Rhodoferax sp.]|nr:50S ribosomal protein L3 N(5)-glutamine methyltransferase [Rhodoferax sp.]